MDECVEVVLGECEVVPIECAEVVLGCCAEVVLGDTHHIVSIYFVCSTHSFTSVMML